MPLGTYAVFHASVSFPRAVTVLAERAEILGIGEKIFASSLLLTLPQTQNERAWLEITVPPGGLQMVIDHLTRDEEYFLKDRFDDGRGNWPVVFLVKETPIWLRLKELVVDHDRH